MSAITLCTESANTLRNEDLGSGRTGDAVGHLFGLAVTPLYPLSAQTVQLFEINSPREAKECFHVPGEGVALPDVKEGDILLLDSVEYPITSVGEWPHARVPTLHIIVGEVKGG